MRTVLCLALAVAAGGCLPETTDESGADAGLATTEQELTTFPLCTTAVTFTNVLQDSAKTMVQDGLTYVAAGTTDVVFTLPTCPTFSGVTVDGVALGTTTGIDNPQKYQVVSDTPVAGGHRVRVRLTLSNAQTGARKNVLIWAANGNRDGARSLPITWIGVADVGRESTISMSADELRSSFASSAYAKFGDDGWARDEHGAKTGWHDFAYQALSVTIDDSVHFHAAQKYRVYSTPFNCDVTATVDGRFRMSRVDNELHVDWVKPPSGDGRPFTVTLTSNGCTFLIAELISGLSAMFDEILVDSTSADLGDSIASGVTCGGLFDLPCALLINRFEYAAGELRTVLDPTLFQLQGTSSVTVKVPYVVSAAGAVGGQLVLPPNATVLITHEGLVNGCFIDTGSPATCNGTAPRKFGGAGLFNLADKSTWPVPDPFEYGTPPLPQREQALAAHAALNRSATLVPAVGHDVGALLGRHGLHRSDLGSPCRIHTDLLAGAPPVTIALGRNDRALNGTPYGAGTALVTARFTINGATSCPDFAIESAPPNPN